MDLQTMVGDLGLSSLGDILWRSRLFLELIAVVLGAALIGFLAARWVYRGQIVDRSEIMRREFAGWRRRSTQSAQSVLRMKRDRTRAERRLRARTTSASSATL
jgi:hypothetical protein